MCILFACTKKGSEEPDAGQGVGRCRLSGFKTYTNGTLAGYGSQISYDAEGRLLSIADPSSRYVFTYRGDTIFAVATGAGCNHTDTIVLEGGRIKVAAYGDGRVHRLVRYFYDAAGVLQRSCCNVNGALQEDYFIWSGGDLMADSIVVDGQP